MNPINGDKKVKATSPLFQHILKIFRKPQLKSLSYLSPLKSEEKLIQILFEKDIPKYIDTIENDVQKFMLNYNWEITSSGLKECCCQYLEQFSGIMIELLKSAISPPVQTSSCELVKTVLLFAIQLGSSNAVMILGEFLKDFLIDIENAKLCFELGVQLNHPRASDTLFLIQTDMDLEIETLNEENISNFKLDLDFNKYKKILIEEY
jgi:hypothetical protein